MMRHRPSTTASPGSPGARRKVAGAGTIVNAIDYIVNGDDYYGRQAGSGHDRGVTRVSSGVTGLSVDDVVPRRGPGRPAVARLTSLSAEDILAEAGKIIRAEGLDALTMKRLADDLGVTVKALYNHVANKAVLLEWLVERVWQQIMEGMPSDVADLFEWLIALQVRIRRVWLENLDLATFSMAVSQPDEQLMRGTAVVAGYAHALGASDIGFFYNSLQTYTFGSIAVAANRRRASAYFGRDPAETLTRAYELADEFGISDDARAVIEAQMEEGDEKHFEAGLRLLVRALLRNDA